MRPFAYIAAALTILSFGSESTYGDSILSPNDFIIAIDFDAESLSRYPDDERPVDALDDSEVTKYLNFGEENSGFIVTPEHGPAQVQSMAFTTANDFAERDPTSWELYGTNDAIQTPDNAYQLREDWVLIDSGSLELPEERFEPSDLIEIDNAAVYSSYQLRFPTVRNKDNANSMQIADVFFYENPSGAGGSILDIADDIRAICVGCAGDSESDSPEMETVDLAIDGDEETKYLNFGEQNSGFIVTPEFGDSIVDSFLVTTANDFDERDPSKWELYGTNDEVVSTNHSFGTEENWTLIDQGILDLPTERFVEGDVIEIDNRASFSSYRMVFTDVRNAEVANSMQISEIQFFGDAGCSDLNGNCLIDAGDLDRLGEWIATNNPAGDLNGDGLIDLNDRDHWIEIIQESWVGDSNFDGQFDSTDLLDVFAEGKYDTGEAATYAQGDWTLDGRFDSDDLLSAFAAGGYDLGTRAATAVPEPSGLTLLAWAAVVTMVRASRRKV